MTVKGSRILLSVKSAAEELKPVLAEANDFSLLSFKVSAACMCLVAIQIVLHSSSKLAV